MDVWFDDICVQIDHKKLKQGVTYLYRLDGEYYSMWIDDYGEIDNEKLVWYGDIDYE